MKKICYTYFIKLGGGHTCLYISSRRSDQGSYFIPYYQINGFVYFEAKDGIDAWDILEKQYIDLIISDIMMPNLDGYELVKSLRKNGYNIPVLMITAKSTFEDMKSGFDVGTDDYMVKPVVQIINERKLRFGYMELSYDDLAICVNGENAIMPQKELYILYKLLSNSNKILRSSR